MNAGVLIAHRQTRRQQQIQPRKVIRRIRQLGFGTFRRFLRVLVTEQRHDFFLAGEMVVDAALADARRTDDFLHTGGFVALLAEKLLCRPQNLPFRFVTLAHVMFPPVTPRFRGAWSAPTKSRSDSAHAVC